MLVLVLRQVLTLELAPSLPPDSLYIDNDSLSPSLMPMLMLMLMLMPLLP